MSDGNESIRATEKVVPERARKPYVAPRFDRATVASQIRGGKKASFIDFQSKTASPPKKD